MPLTASTATMIHQYILNDRIYEDILVKYVPDKEKRDEFRQFLWEIICSQDEEKMLERWNGRFFLYWYTAVVDNQIKSKTSPWHRKNRIFSTEINEAYSKQEYDSFDFLLNENEEQRNWMLETIEEALNYWYAFDPYFKREGDLFKMHFYENLSFDKISKRTKVKKSSVRLYVQSAEAKVRGYMSRKLYLKQ